MDHSHKITVTILILILNIAINLILHVSDHFLQTLKYCYVNEIIRTELDDPSITLLAGLTLSSHEQLPRILHYKCCFEYSESKFIFLVIII
jgi:hypothetical protein